MAYLVLYHFFFSHLPNTNPILINPPLQSCKASQGLTYSNPPPQMLQQSHSVFPRNFTIYMIYINEYVNTILFSSNGKLVDDFNLLWRLPRQFCVACKLVMMEDNVWQREQAVDDGGGGGYGCANSFVVWK